jgi:hypothetical protein
VSKASAVDKKIDEQDLEPFLQVLKNHWASIWATRISSNLDLRTEEATKIRDPTSH